MVFYTPALFLVLKTQGGFFGRKCSFLLQSVWSRTVLWKESTVKFYFSILPLLTILIGKAILLTYRIPSHKNLLEMNKFSLYAICATLNQGNSRFGDSTGKQCACISLFLSTFSQLKEIRKWKSSDLDLILVCGIKPTRILL